jgi:anti-anti-sigma factor
LTWDIQERGRQAYVVVDGELDVGTAPGLSGQLTPLAEAGRDLILDLAGLRFCDCAGLNLFLRAQKHATAAGGSLHLVAVTKQVSRLIAMARLSDVLQVTATAADAIAALNQPANSAASSSNAASPPPAR